MKRQAEANPWDYDSDEGSSYEHSDLPMDEHFCTALHYAAAEGNAELCKEILKDHPKAIFDTTSAGYVALDVAAMKGQLEAFKVLMTNMDDKDVYSPRADGYTTLQIVAMQDEATEWHLEIFAALIARIPEITLVNEDNSGGLLRLAASKGHKAIVKLIGTMCIVKDIYNSLHMEKLSELSDEITINSSRSPLLEDASNIVLGYIWAQDPKIGYPDVNQSNFNYHLKLLKLYTIISREELFQSNLCEAKQNHKGLFTDIDKYIVDNYFMLTGVCKTITQESPILMLKDKGDSCLKNIISCYLVPDLFQFIDLEKEVHVDYSGQDGYITP